MRNHCLVRAVGVENDTVRPRAAAGVDLVAAQDGEFVKGPRVGETESFIIFVLVRILATADLLALGVVVAALVDGVVDVGLVVACVPAPLDALPLREG